MLDNDKRVEELVDDFARIIHRQKFGAGVWDEIVIKEPWLEVARAYFKAHPDLCLIAPVNYSDNTPILVAFQRRGQWCGVIPIAEVLKEGTMTQMLIPVEGCEGCSTTGGVSSCPTHSPKHYIQEQAKPFVQLYIKCPHCGQGLQFDGYEYIPLSEKLNKEKKE